MRVPRTAAVRAAWVREDEMQVPLRLRKGGAGGAQVPLRDRFAASSHTPPGQQTPLSHSSAARSPGDTPQAPQDVGSSAQLGGPGQAAAGGPSAFGSASQRSMSRSLRRRYAADDANMSPASITRVDECASALLAALSAHRCTALAPANLFQSAWWHVSDWLILPSVCDWGDIGKLYSHMWHACERLRVLLLSQCKPCLTGQDCASVVAPKELQLRRGH